MESNNMFLDDALYNFVKANENEDFNMLITSTYEMTRMKLKSYITEPNPNPLEIRNAFKKIFSAWDLFVRKLKRENNKHYELFELFSFKNILKEDAEFVKMAKLLGIGI